MTFLRTTRCAGLAAFFLAAVAPAADPPPTGTEWNRLLATLGNLGTLAGGDFQDSSNSNEWNPAWEGTAAWPSGAGAVPPELSEPHMAMDDIWGNIYIADKNAHAIRKITTDGRIVTVAGRHRYLNPNTGGYDGDGIATEKLLSYPNGLFVLPDGTFYFIETGDSSARPGFPAGQPETNSRIRRVDRAGNMTTLYTDTPLDIQRGLWVSMDGSWLYFTTNKRLKKWTAANPANPTVLMDLSATGADLANIDVAANGDILVTDRFLHRVYRVPPTASNLTNPVTVAGNGSTDPNRPGDVSSRDGSVATAVPMDEVRGAAFHPLGGYFLACHKGGDLWYVDTANTVHVVLQGGNSGTTRAGDGLPVTTNRTSLKIAEPRSVRVGWNGDIILCTNDSGYLRVIRSTCVRQSLPAGFDSQRRLQWNAVAGKSYFVERSTGLGAAAWQTLEFRHPAAPGIQVFQDAAPPVQRGFYRLHEFRRWPQ